MNPGAVSASGRPSGVSERGPKCAKDARRGEPDTGGIRNGSSGVDNERAGGRGARARNSKKARPDIGAKDVTVAILFSAKFAGR